MIIKESENISKQKSHTINREKSVKNLSEFDLYDFIADCKNCNGF